MDGGFNFIDGDLGYIIQKAPGITDSNPMVSYHEGGANDLGHIIEVHYLGSAATTVMVGVDNLTGALAGGSSQVNYVTNNIYGHDTGTEHQIQQDSGNDASQWRLEIGSNDPAYGLVNFSLTPDFIKEVLFNIDSASYP